MNCHVIIEAPIGKQVDMTFSTLFTKNDICVSPDTGIAVHDGNSSAAMMMSKLCSLNKFVDRKFKSSSGYLYIHFATRTSPIAFKAVFDYSKFCWFN